MNSKSLGMIETRGYVGAVEGADAGMKAANVVFLGYEVIRTGLVMVVFAGDVAAVKTAVSAGVAAAVKVGQVVSRHVIPRPDSQIPLPPHGFTPEPLPAAAPVAAESLPVSLEAPQPEKPKRVAKRKRKVVKAETRSAPPEKKKRSAGKKSLTAPKGTTPKSPRAKKSAAKKSPVKKRAAPKKAKAKTKSKEEKK